MEDVQHYVTRNIVDYTAYLALLCTWIKEGWEHVTYMRLN